MTLLRKYRDSGTDAVYDASFKWPVQTLVKLSRVQTLGRPQRLIRMSACDLNALMNIHRIGSAVAALQNRATPVVGMRRRFTSFMALLRCRTISGAAGKTRTSLIFCPNPTSCEQAQREYQ